MFFAPFYFLKSVFFKWDLQNVAPFSKYISTSRKYTHHDDVLLKLSAIVYVIYSSVLVDKFYIVSKDCVSKESLYTHLGT